MRRHSSVLVIGSEAQSLGVTLVDGPGRDYVCRRGKCAFLCSGRRSGAAHLPLGEGAVRPTNRSLHEYVPRPCGAQGLALIAAARDQQRMDPCPPLLWTAIRPVWQASPQPVLAGHL